MKNFTVKKALPILILLGLIAIQGQTLAAYARLNIGNLMLNRLMADPSENLILSPEQFFLLATRSSVTNRAAWRGVGLASVLRGDLEAAVHAWQRAEKPGRELIDFGEQRIREGKQDEGLYWLQAAAELDFAATATPLASLMHDQKNFEGAINLWERALASYPKSPKRLTWWQGLSRSLLSNEEWQKAEEISEQALNEFPGNPQLLTSLGSALLGLGADFETISDVLERAISLDDSNAEANSVMARLMLRENYYEESFTYFDRAIKRDPTVKWWYVARANSARQLGNLEKARTLLLGTIDLFPGYAPAYYELAWIYRLTDDPIRAQNAIQQALNLHNSPPVNYYVRAGDIYAWSNELEQAQTAYEQASQLAPNDQRVIQGLESLGKSE